MEPSASAEGSGVAWLEKIQAQEKILHSKTFDI